jgi:hypothetical protein
MAKGSFFEDTFEKLVELGSATTKKTGKTVSQTFSPLKITEKMLGLDSDQSIPNQNETEEKKQNKHTPLNFEKLKKQYAEQDAQKQESLRNRLFQLIKQGDEKILHETSKKKEQQKLTEERTEVEEKKRRQIAQQQTQETTIPRGKIRRSIFAPKKVAQKQHTEIKPSTGKN